MENTVITSEPPATTTPKAKKRKMSAADKKALSDAAKARWAARKAAFAAFQPASIPPLQAVPMPPSPPSPAILALQTQVVELVSQRAQSRTMLNEAHAAYLSAQSKFQAAESELKGIEAEVQYRIGLIGQLENRPERINVTSNYAIPSPVLQMPASLSGVTSEPAQAPTQPRRSNEQFAVGSADDLRRDVRGMM